jgi:hypothetical protein
MAAANGATINPHPKRAASSIEGLENEPTKVGIGL